jgi:hypothetical protein
VHGVYSAMIYDWLKVYGLDGMKVINFDRYKCAPCPCVLFFGMQTLSADVVETYV